MDEILARAGIFQGVEPTAVASALTKQLQPVDFPRGHTVFAEGEPGDRLYIIISGKVKIGRRSPDGRENLLTIMGPSDMFGELSTFDPGPRTRVPPPSPKSAPCRWTVMRCARGSPTGPRSPSSSCACWPGVCGAPTTTSPTSSSPTFPAVREAAAAARAALRHAGGRRASRDARPHPGRDRRVGRRVARDGQQALAEFAHRGCRLEAERPDQRLRAAGPPGPLAPAPFVEFYRRSPPVADSTNQSRK